jgi:cysteine desulfurase
MGEKAYGGDTGQAEEKAICKGIYPERWYMDYNASTPVDPVVKEAMLPFLGDHFGNPSTGHWAAVNAREAVGRSRERIASLLDCSAEEIIFTSGGSEANNHALKGVYTALQHKGRHIITTEVEHPAVLAPCRFLERLGARITHVGVDEYGRVRAEEIEQALTEETILISVMHANNEVGTVQPVAEVGRLARSRNILFHTDASQSVGKIETRVDQLNVDLLTVAGHKMYAPKGVGALYVRKGTPLEPLIHGAGHEQGRRAGTENVPYVVGLGKAAELVKEDLLAGKPEQIRQLRDEMWRLLQYKFGEKVHLFGHPEHRLPNTLSVSFLGYTGDDVLQAAPEVAASTGAACHSGEVKLSSVLRAMGVSSDVGKGTVRFSLGRYTTETDIEAAVALLAERMSVL